MWDRQLSHRLKEGGAGVRTACSCRESRTGIPGTLSFISSLRWTAGVNDTGRCSGWIKRQTGQLFLTSEVHLNMLCGFWSFHAMYILPWWTLLFLLHDSWMVALVNCDLLSASVGDQKGLQHLIWSTSYSAGNVLQDKSRDYGSDMAFLQEVTFKIRGQPLFNIYLQIIFRK